jgi:hypothetical protein
MSRTNSIRQTETNTNKQSQTAIDLCTSYVQTVTNVFTATTNVNTMMAMRYIVKLVLLTVKFWSIIRNTGA